MGRNGGPLASKLSFEDCSPVVLAVCYTLTELCQLPSRLLKNYS